MTPQGIDLLARQFGSFNVLLSTINKTELGIPVESGMIANKQSITKVSANDIFTNQSLGYEFFSTIQANKIQGGTFSGSSIAIGGQFYVNSAGDAQAENIVITGGSLDIGSSFSVSNTGVLVATDATISGSVDVTGGSLTIGSDFSVSNTGALTASGATISGNVDITSGSIAIGSYFSVSNTGVLDASSATITGAINATSGTIGGFTINSTSLSGNGSITGGVITGTTIHLPNAGGWLTFDNTSGSPDADIIEDTNDNLIIRAGSGGTIAFEPQDGSTVWGEVTSAGFNTSGGISASGTVSAGGFSTGGTVSAGTIVGNAVNTNGNTWTFATINTGTINCGTINAGGNTVNSGRLNSGTIGIYNGTVGGGVMTGPVSAAIYFDSNGSDQYVFANNNGAATFAVDVGGNGAFYSNLTQGANNTGNYLTCNNFTNHGAKDSLEWTSQGTKALSCVEATEVWYEEIGENKIVNGKCAIELDPLYLEVTEGDYHVFLSGYGESKFLYSQRDTISFIVLCDVDISFSYKIMRHRRHYAHFRFHTWDDIDNISEEHNQNVRNIQEEKRQYDLDHPRPIPTWNPELEK